MAVNNKLREAATSEDLESLDEWVDETEAEYQTVLDAMREGVIPDNPEGPIGPPAPPPPLDIDAERNAFEELLQLIVQHKEPDTKVTVLSVDEFMSEIE